MFKLTLEALDQLFLEVLEKNEFEAQVILDVDGRGNPVIRYGDHEAILPLDARNMSYAHIVDVIVNYESANCKFM